MGDSSARPITCCNKCLRMTPTGVPARTSDTSVIGPLAARAAINAASVRQSRAICGRLAAKASLKNLQIARRRQRFGREHFAIMPRAGLDQLLFLRDVDKRQLRQSA